MRLHLFGHPQICDGRNQPLKLQGPALTLLAYLALERSPQPRAHLARLFYPAADTRRARNNLAKLLWQLRQALGEPALEGDYHTITLPQQAGIWVDALEFEGALPRIEAAWGAGSQPGAALAGWLARTLTLYRGLLLQDAFLTDSDALHQWRLVAQERFRRHYLHWSYHLVQYHLGQGQWPEAEAALDHARRQEPLDEPLAMQHLLLLAAQQRHNKIEAAVQRYTRRVQEELDISPTAQFYALAEQLQQRQPAQALRSPASSAPPVRFSPPVPLTYLYGRTAQIDHIVQRLLAPGERLLTLVGMGGAGKTALAQAIGGRLAGAFRNGACFVPLAGVQPGPHAAAAQQQVALAIAAALGVNSPRESETLAALRSFLSGQELLLILDNCEHVLAAAPLLVDLLAHAPLVRVLATSRQRLNLSAEAVEPVAGLATPASGAGAQALAGSPAAQLFLARARRALPDFPLADQNAAAIAAICQAVDGMPLAIELAAHWVTLFDPAEIAAAIDRQLTFLVTPHVDVPERHRSMLAVFEHSWRLLSPDEQAALASLSLFRAGFDRQAALAVTACDDAVLARLAACSLLQVKAPGAYALHPLVESFAAGRRAPDDASAQRYAACFLQHLHPDSAGRLALAGDRALAEKLIRHAADLTQAWELAVAARQDDLLARALPHAIYYWKLASQLCEGVRLLQLLIEVWQAGPSQDAAHPLHLGRAHHQVATALSDLGEHQRALQHGASAQALLRSHAAPAELGRLLIDLGRIYTSSEQAEQAAAILQSAWGIAEAQGDISLQLDVTRQLAVLHWTAGDWEQATDLQRSALAAIPVDFEFGPDLFEFYKDVFHQAVWLQDWALAEQVWQRSTTWCERHPATHEQRLSQRAQTINLCVGQGRWSEAYQLAQDMAQQVAATGNRVVYCETLLWGSRIALHVDQAAAALVQAEEALSVATAEGFPTLFPLIHRTLGAAEAALERPTEARRHVTAALELTLAKGQEKHGLMGLLGGIFQLACLEQERLPRPLFERAVALAATRPHTGIVARLEAQALAQREGIDLAQEEAQARRPTDWAELELMARELLSCAMAD